jgi:phosphoglycolate phosphatase-like HAD superfamily hydrolase
VTNLLVLWDIDRTLLDAGGVGAEAYTIAFRRLFGRDPVLVRMAGRTDRAIVTDTLRSSGVEDVEPHLEPLRAAAEEALDEIVDQLPSRGRALPGAADALAAMQAEGVVQSLLTGNVRRFAEVKVRAFALDGYLDLDAGGYGWAHVVRAHLVGVAREAAAARYGRAYPGRATVLVGDTPLDVEAALATGAAVVAVATGNFTVDELAAAGAHVVLQDLTSTSEVLAAVRYASQVVG